MARNTHLIHAIADALIETHGQDATEWLECGGRAAIERGVAGWRAAISEAAWIDRPEDVLVLRALRHIEHTMVLTGGEDIAVRIRALVDEDWHGRRPGGEGCALGRSSRTTSFAATPASRLSPSSTLGASTARRCAVRTTSSRGTRPRRSRAAEARVEVCLAEARYVERRVPFLNLPGRVRQAKAMANADDDRGWTPVDDGPIFRYVRCIREEGEERMVPPDLRLRTVYLVELVCPPDRSVVVAEEGLRGRLEDVASTAVANARVSRRWRVGPIDPIRVKRIEYDLDERTDIPVPAA